MYRDTQELQQRVLIVDVQGVAIALKYDLQRSGISAGIATSIEEMNRFLRCDPDVELIAISGQLLQADMSMLRQLRDQFSGKILFVVFPGCSCRMPRGVDAVVPSRLIETIAAHFDHLVMV